MTGAVRARVLISRQFRGTIHEARLRARSRASARWALFRWRGVIKCREDERPSIAVSLPMFRSFPEPERVRERRNESEQESESPHRTSYTARNAIRPVSRNFHLFTFTAPRPFEIVSLLCCIGFSCCLKVKYHYRGCQAASFVFILQVFALFIDIF